MYLCCLPLCLLTVALWQSSVEAADAMTPRGSAVAQTCVTCHSPEGQSQGAMPSLARLASTAQQIEDVVAYLLTLTNAALHAFQPHTP